MSRPLSPLRFALVAVITSLGAIGSFTGVAGVFGGGLEGYVAATIVAVIIFVVAMLGSSHLMGQREEADVSKEPEPMSGPPRTSGYVCDQGPYEVGAGDMQEIELDVRQGERIHGYVRAVDGQDFAYYIVDERNLVAAQNREEFSYVRSGESVTADRIRWKASNDGPWYLLVDLYGKQYDRTIRVNLRRY